MSSDTARYLAASHVVQSGVAMEMNIPSRARATEPKFLRVGVNSAMVDHAALVGLLVLKGIITDDEYMKAIADAMEAEKERYEKALSQHYGKKITLG